jgi:hypothetical protein
MASVYSHMITLVHRSRITYILKMEAILLPKRVLTISTRRHIPEDGILHSHRRENLKSYIVKSDIEATFCKCNRWVLSSSLGLKTGQFKGSFLFFPLDASRQTPK